MTICNIKQLGVMLLLSVFNHELGSFYCEILINNKNMTIAISTSPNFKRSHLSLLIEETQNWPLLSSSLWWCYFLGFFRCFLLVHTIWCCRSALLSRIAFYWIVGNRFWFFHYNDILIRAAVLLDLLCCDYEIKIIENSLKTINILYITYLSSHHRPDTFS